MKRKFLPLFVIIFLVTFSANAQFNKGNVLLGASLGFNYGSGTSVGTSSNSNLSPRLGMAVDAHSVLGIYGGIAYNTTNDQVGDKTTNTSYSAGLFWKRFMPIKNKLGWYVESDASFNSQNTEQNVQGTKSSIHSTGYSAGVVPGLYYQAVPKVIVSANVGGLAFTQQHQEVSNTYHYSQLNLSLLSSFVFSVDFVL